MNEANKRPTWSPSVENALSARKTLVGLIEAASEQAFILGDLQKTLTALAKSKSDESTLSVCNALRIQIGELHGILIGADAEADTRVIVSGSVE
ncbi:hypothetical protein AWB71_00685 [Caballeronia peredens]|nr:hypothetical protein AWB71_00685 [Caballeronia peredens]